MFFGYRGDGLNITSIRIIKNHLNLGQTISAITALDHILSRNVDKHNQILKESNYGDIISHLFDYMLNDNPSNQEFKLHPYVYDTFKCFANFKSDIDISLHDGRKWVRDKKLLNLLFHGIVKAEIKRNTDKDGYVELENKNNLIKPEFFRIFNNVEKIIISASSSIPDEGKFVYPMNLLSLLNIISDTKVKKMQINVNKHKDIGICGWLGAIESSSKWSTITNAYIDRGFQIELQENPTKSDHDYMRVMIVKH